MKYIIELEPIEGTDLYRAKGANTLVFDKKGIKNILTPYEEPKEIDWSKVPVDTPVLVWNRYPDQPYKRYFSSFNPEDSRPYVCFSGGCTSWSDVTNHSGWKYCKLASPEQAKEEWFK